MVIANASFLYSVVEQAVFKLARENHISQQQYQVCVCVHMHYIME